MVDVKELDRILDESYGKNNKHARMDESMTFVRNSDILHREDLTEEEKAELDRKNAEGDTRTCMSRGKDHYEYE